MQALPSESELLLRPHFTPTCDANETSLSASSTHNDAMRAFVEAMAGMIDLTTPCAGEPQQQAATTDAASPSHRVQPAGAVAPS